MAETQDKADIAAAVTRLREMNADLSDWDRIREEGEQISREEGYHVLAAEIATLHAENERLRLIDAQVRRSLAVIAADDFDCEPAAWLACPTDGRDDLAEVHISAADAEKAALAWGGQVTPLFFGVGLTQEERQAIAWVCGDVADITGPIEATLRALLDRTQTVKE